MTQRRVAAALWLSLAVGFILWSRRSGLSPIEAGEQFQSRLADNWWGPVLFIVVYVVRPLVFFPASVLTVLGGLAFGPVWGLVWTIVASNASAASAYVVARFFGDGPVAERLRRLLGEIVERATNAPFETTLLMRLLYLPFDPVSYVAGFIRLGFIPFMAGSALGSLPGTAAFVGFGASVESLDAGTPAIDLRLAAASLALAVAGIVGSRLLRARLG